MSDNHKLIFDLYKISIFLIKIIYIYIYLYIYIYREKERERERERAKIVDDFFQIVDYKVEKNSKNSRVLVDF
jgi:hypothetical protein